MKVLDAQLCLTHGPEPTRLFCPWNSPGKNFEVGTYLLLPGVFPTRDRTQGSCIAGRFFTIRDGTIFYHICVYVYVHIYIYKHAQLCVCMCVCEHVQFNPVTQSCLNPVIPWTTACKASLSITNCQSLLKLMSIELVMPSNQFILCHPLLLLPSNFPSIRVFSK